MAGRGRSREPKNPLSLHDRALGLLAVRPRSRRELQTRLLRAGFEPHEVEDELGRLEAVGLVDDERFAEEFADHALGRRLEGRRSVAASLASKGVDRGTIERTLDELGGDDAPIEVAPEVVVTDGAAIDEPAPASTSKSKEREPIAAPAG